MNTVHQNIRHDTFARAKLVCTCPRSPSIFRPISVQKLNDVTVRKSRCDIVQVVVASYPSTSFVLRYVHLASSHSRLLVLLVFNISHYRLPVTHAL